MTFGLPLMSFPFPLILPIPIPVPIPIPFPVMPCGRPWVANPQPPSTKRSPTPAAETAGGSPPPLGRLPRPLEPMIKTEVMDTGSSGSGRGDTATEEEEQQRRCTYNLTRMGLAAAQQQQQQQQQQKQQQQKQQQQQQQHMLLTLKRKNPGDSDGTVADSGCVADESLAAAGSGDKMAKLVIKHEIKHKENEQVNQVDFLNLAYELFWSIFLDRHW